MGDRSEVQDRGSRGSMNLRRWFPGLALLALLAGCSARGPMLHELGADELYTLGMQHFEARKWGDAIRALEQFASRYPSDPRIQEVRYRIGEAYFEKREYVTASAELVRLATDYPLGTYADDARFKTCESYYRLSPKPQLDQEYTLAAIDHCEALVQYFPNSEFAPKAKELLDDLSRKLAQKAFLSADYYYRRQAYDSSIIYFEDLLARYPDSEYAPRALLRLVQIYQRLGYREEMEEAKDRLLRDYPETAEAVQAREITLANRQ